jgi:DNA-binding PadR family transcriptional regulator
MVSKALIAASTKPIILSILIIGENYGYQIIQRAKKISGGTLDWSDGMLYPVLHRLEKDGFIASQWKKSEEGRYRKYYSLTDLGKEELAAEKKQWLSVHSALAKLWKPIAA